MKTILSILLILGSLSVSAAPAGTREPHHEIVLGVSPLAGFGSRATGGDVYWDFDDSFFTSVGLAYNYAIWSFLQIGLNSSFALTDVGGTSIKFLQLIGGPTINIPFGDDWLHNSLFVVLNGGMLVVDTGSTQIEAMLNGEVGYRVSLAENVTWRPSAGAMKILNGSKFNFIARPVSFSFVF